jgi:hypothetical protein
MKLDKYYEEIKTKIFEGLKDRKISFSKLAIYFKEIQYTKVGGDFNRACDWVGFQLNRFWRNQLFDLYNEGINDDHVSTLYRKFFKELKFNQEAIS